MLFDNRGVLLLVYERYIDFPKLPECRGKLWTSFEANQLHAFPWLLRFLGRHWPISRASVEQALDELLESPLWTGIIPFQEPQTYVSLMAVQRLSVEERTWVPLAQDACLHPVWQEVVATKDMEGICPICRGEKCMTNVHGIVESCTVCSGSGRYAGYGFLRKRDLVKMC